MPFVDHFCATDSQSSELPLSAEDSALKLVSWCHCEKNAQFSMFFNRPEERHQLRAMALVRRVGGALVDTNVTRGFCVSRRGVLHARHFDKRSKFALIDAVVFLSPVVTWAGLASGVSSDWTDRLPLVSRRFRFERVGGACACASTPLSPLIFYLLPSSQDGSCERLGPHSESRMQVAGEKTTFPRRSRPLECHPYGADEALTLV